MIPMVPLSRSERIILGGLRWLVLAPAGVLYLFYVIRTGMRCEQSKTDIKP